MNRIKSVCVYCASSTKIDQTYFDTAEELGRLLAQHEITLINGAGSIGLMKASTDATLKAGGKAIGVIPQFMVDEGWQHEGMSQLIVTDSMHQRKQWMAEHGDGSIALPGGCGTLEELLEVITWKQLGLYGKPIVILNVKGYFDPLLEMLDKAVEEHFMREVHKALWTVATSAQEAVEQLLHAPQPDKDIRRFAAI